jgi:hypothetical protein
MNDNENSAALQGFAGQQGLRLGPKPWAECTADEKCDRLREQVEAWRRVCDQLRSRLSLLEGHRHGSAGEMLVLLDQVDRNQMNQAMSSYNTLR